MAETCGWADCRSSEVQPHMVTRQCLTCGRHSDLYGNPVVWQRDRELAEGRWVRPEES